MITNLNNQEQKIFFYLHATCLDPHLHWWVKGHMWTMLRGLNRRIFTYVARASNEEHYLYHKWISWKELNSDFLHQIYVATYNGYFLLWPTDASTYLVEILCAASNALLLSTAKISLESVRQVQTPLKGRGGVLHCSWNRWALISLGLFKIRVVKA